MYLIVLLVGVQLNQSDHRTGCSLLRCVLYVRLMRMMDRWGFPMLSYCESQDWNKQYNR